MPVHPLRCSLCFAALLGFIGLSGCDQPSTGDAAATTETAAGDADHDHGDHDHGDHDHADHDHGDHDHDHAEQDHPEGDQDHDHGDHDHGDDHDHDFKTLDEAVAEISSLRDQIRDGFADNDVDAAHGPLHHVGEVLEATETLLPKLKLSEESQQAAGKAVESLFADFGAVDESLHGEEGKSYDEVSESIDKAIATLKSSAESTE